ncbi:hypothetical protein BFINE_25060 [Bacteroides finegoldii DSM 17565]|nr:hypothetical protein BFINE_25060 [Bacteroides finegoldii DSM 17565]
MDGKQKQYYVKANSEYKIELVSALSDNNAGNVIEDFTLFYEKDPSLSGKPVPFIAVDDMTSPRLYSGKAKFKIYSLMVFFRKENLSWSWFPELYSLKRIHICLKREQSKGSLFLFPG